MSALTGILRAVGEVLYRCRLHRPIIWLHRHQPKVLVYHACATAEGDFLQGLQSNTTPVQLAAHLEFLDRHYRIVPLESLHAGTVPAFGVVLTFDDGYRSVFQEAFPQLKQRRVPATVYLITDVIDNLRLAWVNALLWLLATKPAATRELLGHRLGVSAALSPAEVVRAAQAALAPAAIASAISEAATASGVDLESVAREAQLYLSRAEIAEMATAGITFGNHTATHPNLARLAAADQRSEMARAEATLAGLPGRIPSFAYPFGAHDADGASLGRSLGLISMMEVGGVNGPLNLGSVARVPVGNASVARLFAEMEIVTPVKAWVRRVAGRAAPGRGHEAYA